MQDTPDIHLITTGGTIESVADDNAVSLDVTKRLTDPLKYFALTRNVRLSTSSPIRKLSENIIPADWVTLICAIKDAYAKGHHRIVITHGTDTMAYSVSAVATLSALYKDAKICFTGSYLPPEDENSDWKVNVSAAIDWVKADATLPGVYVAFRADASNSAARIISSENLKPMSFDSLSFDASFEHYAGFWKDGNITSISTKHMGQVPILANVSIAAIKKRIQAAASEVCMIETHPGLDYQKLANFIAAYRVALFGLYHSGTGPGYHSKTSLIQLLKFSPGNTQCVFCVYPSEYITVPYDSTREIIHAGGIVVKDIQPHQLYVYIVLGIAAGIEIDTLLDGVPLLAVA